MTVHEVGAKLLLDQAVPWFLPKTIRNQNNQSKKKKDLTILMFSSL